MLERLTAEVNKIQDLPETASKMASMNFEPPPVKTAQQFRGTVQQDLVNWKKIAVDAGIKLDN